MGERVFEGKWFDTFWIGGLVWCIMIPDSLFFLFFFWLLLTTSGFAGFFS